MDKKVAAEFLNPLKNKIPRFSEEHLNEIIDWFETKSKPYQYTDSNEFIQFITIDQLMAFLEERKYHRRIFYYPSYGEVMIEAEKLKAAVSRLLSKEQVLYLLDKWVIEPDLKHELKLAFKEFDSEHRTFLDMDEVQLIVTTFDNPFNEFELLELLRDVNVRGDGNVFYENFVDSIFSLAPELYDEKAEFLYEDPNDDPTFSQANNNEPNTEVNKK